MNSKKQFFTRKRIILLATAVVLLILIIFAFDTRLMVRKYSIEAKEIETPIRIALVTDLHSCYYGKNQSELIDTIEAEMPDVILLGGDIFDDVKEDTNTELFLAGIADKYPCYYVTGNHECWGGTYRFGNQMAILEKYRISVLSGETLTLTVNGETINLCGVDDPDVYMVNTDLEQDPEGYIQAQTNKEDTFLSQIAAVSETTPEDSYTILLSHRPEYYEAYTGHGFDLVLCGHAHGGQWRIPGILNGLYAPHQGVFPKYAGGRYDSENMTMIVSRGLAKETTRIPRIFNRPELVVIDVK